MMDSVTIEKVKFGRSNRVSSTVLELARFCRHEERLFVKNLASSLLCKREGRHEVRKKTWAMTNASDDLLSVLM